jgi:hypothetical protein
LTLLLRGGCCDLLASDSSFDCSNSCSSVIFSFPDHVKCSFPVGT